MTEYAIGLHTIDGVGDSDYVERLADALYELDALIDPVIVLNDDGSLNLSFGVEGESMRDASSRLLDALEGVFAEAQPLRIPTQEEAARGEEVFAEFSVRSGDREPALA